MPLTICSVPTIQAESKNMAEGKPAEGAPAPEQKPIMIPKERFDEVNNQLKEIKAWKADQDRLAQEAETKRLAEQGEYKKIAENAQKEAEALKARYTETAIQSAVKIAAVKAGAHDPDIVMKLVEAGKVKMSEDGSVDQASVEAVINEMKESKKYLFGTGSVNIGSSGGAPAGGSQLTYHTMTQIADPVYFEKNKEDILRAQKEGRIIKG